MNDRLKALIQRVTESLLSEGLTKKEIRTQKETGVLDYSSYFEMMIDLRLEGKPEPKAQEIWESGKEQINYLISMVNQAGEDYRKLENRCRNLESDLVERIKEK